MRTRAFVVSLLLVGLLPSSGLGRPVRLALIVGHNQGVAPDAPLQYAERDAIRVAEALREVGQFDDLRVRVGIAAAGLLAELDRARQAIAGHKARGDQVFFLFFFSGHGSAGELHLGGSIVPADSLLSRVAASGADLKMTVIDACQSGTLAREKGVVARPAVPLEVRAELDATGQAMLASTSTGEAAQESELLQGSFFTSHLVSALRGAADSNGDGRVTLQEAYAYAYERTVRSTTTSAAGIQHPTYALHLRGKHDIVLSWPTRSPAFLSFRSRSEGSFLLFSSNEEKLIAEVQSRTGDSRRIGVREGEYVVKKRGVTQLLVARVRLRRGSDAVLDENEMQGVPYAVLARKGARAPGWLTLSLGVANPLLGTDELLGLQVGAVFVLGRLGIWPSLEVAFGAGAPNQLDVILVVVRPGLAAVGLSRFHRWDLHYGVKLAVPLYLDHVEGSGWSKSTGFDATVPIGAAVWLSERAGLLASLEAGIRLLRLDDGHGGSRWTVRPTVGLNLGARLRF